MLAAISVAVSAFVTGGAGSAQAKALSPSGAPSAAPVYVEDFGNLPATGPGSAVAVQNYTGGAAAHNQTYTADATRQGTSCNGWVISANSVQPPDPCLNTANPVTGNAVGALRDLATALGRFRGLTATQAADNHAVGEQNGPGSQPGVLLMTSPDAVPAVAGHYYAVAEDHAVVDYNGGGIGCGVQDPQVSLALLDGGTVHTLASGLDPCTAPGNSDIAVNGVNVRVAGLLSNAYLWTGGSTMGVQISDLQTAGSSGDHDGFDDVRVIDATPHMDQSFSPASLPVGGITTLTLRITGTDDLLAKNGWAFSDTLMAGLTVADSATSTDCPAGVVTAAAGGDTIQVSGNLDAGMSSCSVTVHVTSTVPCVYTNGAADFNISGLTLPTPATVTFTSVPLPPGVAQSPPQLYFEDFESLPASGAGSTVRIQDYVGSPSAHSQAYSADGGWNGTSCNGWVLSANSDAPTGDSCATSPSLDGMRALATALGELRGEAPAQAADNHALTQFTGPGTPGPGVEMRSTSNVVPATAGRYYTVGADVAAIDYRGGAVGCDNDDPSLSFSLVDGTTPQTVISGVDPCTAPGNHDITVGASNARVARITSTPFKWAGGSVTGIQIYNAQGSTNGNDHAIDNLHISDVTPQLDMAYSPTSVPQGGVSTLTFTVTNTSELGAKTGWSFTDTLSTGLTVADNAATTNCPQAVVTAAAGSGTVSVSGDLTAGMTSCTVAVHVTSAAAETYFDSASNIKVTGLNEPPTASVEFTQDNIPPTLHSQSALVTASMVQPLCPSAATSAVPVLDFNISPGVDVVAGTTHIEYDSAHDVVTWGGWVSGSVDTAATLTIQNACASSTAPMAAGALFTGGKMYGIKPVAPGEVSVAELNPAISEATMNRPPAPRSRLGRHVRPTLPLLTVSTTRQPPATGKQPPPSVKLRARPAPHPRLAGCSDTNTTPVIDVLALYTPKARAAMGGDSQAVTQIMSSEGLTNTAFSNSGINARIHIVGVQAANGYTGPDDNTGFVAFGNGTDGANGPALRDQAGADIASLFVSGGTGVGYMPVPPTSGTSSQGFNQDNINYIPYYTNTHELGHNFGANHDLPNSDPNSLNSAFPYNHGYTPPSQSWRTIMAYPNICNSCAVVPYFSNPSKVYNGEAMGTSNGADNTRMLNSFAATVAAYRPTQNPQQLCDFSVSVSSAAGGQASTDSQGPFPPNTTVTVTAWANPGYTFTGWLLDGQPYGSTSPVSVPIGSSSHSMTATFALIPGGSTNPGSGSGASANYSRSMVLLPNGAQQAFLTASNGHLVTKWQSTPGSAWSSSDLGGSFTGTPNAVVNGQGVISVFATGTDGNLYTSWQSYQGGPLSGFANLGGASIASTPNIVFGTGGGMQVFARTSGGNLATVWQSRAGAGWSGWANMGGSFTSTPLGTVTSQGAISVFATGTDGNLYTSWQSTPGGPLTGFANLGGGSLASGPNVVFGASGAMQVFAVTWGGNLATVWQSRAGSSWSGWANMGGFFTGSPAAYASSQGVLSVFVTGVDGNLYTSWQSGPGGPLSSFTSLGGHLMTSAPTVSVFPDGRMNVFETDANRNLYTAWQTAAGSAWAGWAAI